MGEAYCVHTVIVAVATAAAAAAAAAVGAVVNVVSGCSLCVVVVVIVSVLLKSCACSAAFLFLQQLLAGRHATPLRPSLSAGGFVFSAVVLPLAFGCIFSFLAKARRVASYHVLFVAVVAAYSKTYSTLLKSLAKDALDGVAFRALLDVPIIVVDATLLTRSKVLRFLRCFCYCYIVLRARKIKSFNWIMKDVTVVLFKEVI